LIGFIVTTPLEALTQAYERTQEQVARLEESLAKKVLDLEDIGWTKLTGRNDDGTGLTLDNLKELTENLRDMAAVNPLLKRGAQLRHAYVFGRGIAFTNTNSKTDAAIKNRYNKAVAFSTQARSTLNLAKYTDGNVFIIRDANNILTHIPLAQIASYITDPDDATRVRYFLREWSDGKDTKKRWYPVSRYKNTLVGRGRRGSGIPATITLPNTSETIPVAQDEVIYHETSNRQTGWTFGVPDSLAAAVWTVAYSSYLTDNASLVKALQQIAWTVQKATKKTGTEAAISMAQPGIGGTAITPGGTVLSSAGVPSAQVNMNNGQPLAAMVATSLGVPVIALLSSPGATGGSYGAATTLDEPTLKGMTAIQDEWKDFYEELLIDMGSTDVEVTFPNISQDPVYRELQSLAQAYTSGGLHQDEYRDAVLNLLDVQQMHENMPKPDNFNAGADPNNPSDPTPSQGNTGAVPGGTNQNQGDHTMDQQQ